MRSNDFAARSKSRGWLRSGLKFTLVINLDRDAYLGKEIGCKQTWCRSADHGSLVLGQVLIFFMGMSITSISPSTYEFDQYALAEVQAHNPFISKQNATR